MFKSFHSLHTPNLEAALALADCCAHTQFCSYFILQYYCRTSDYLLINPRYTLTYRLLAGSLWIPVSVDWTNCTSHFQWHRSNHPVPKRYALTVLPKLMLVYRYHFSHNLIELAGQTNFSLPLPTVYLSVCFSQAFQ